MNRQAGRIAHWAPCGLVVVIVLILGGCSWPAPAGESGPPADPPEGDALVSVISSRGVAHHVGKSLTTDMLAMQTMDWLKAEGDLVIEDAELAIADDGLVVEAFVVNFLYRARDHAAGRSSWMDSPDTCIAQWPPQRPLGRQGGPEPDEDWRGSLYPIEGLQIKAGDRFAVSVIARAPGRGVWDAEGVRLRYRHEGQWFHQTVNAWSLTLHVEEHAADFDGGVCDPADHVGYDKPWPDER